MKSHDNPKPLIVYIFSLPFLFYCNLGFTNSTAKNESVSTLNCSIISQQSEEIDKPEEDTPAEEDPEC